MRNVNVKLFRSDEKRFDCGGKGLLLVDVMVLVDSPLFRYERMENLHVKLELK